MPLLIDEACIKNLITLDDALAAVEEVFHAQGTSDANVTNVPRVRVPVKGGIVRITAAVLTYRGYYGVKISSTAVFGRDAGRMFCLYREDCGALVAIVQVFAMGALRTGAASGVATKYLANEDAAVLGVLGSGRQARTQVEAVCKVRPIREVRVFSPNQAHREAFCADFKKFNKIKYVPVDTAEAAVRGADVIVSAATSETPVVLGDWLKPGAHINAIGANYEHRRELDRDAVCAAKFICADDIEQVRYESSDLAEPVKAGLLRWENVHPLAQVVAGRLKGRTAREDITIFKSLGVAIEDVALAVRVYERAVASGLGVPLPDIAG
ncbi:MAG: ornithine cyclodeaminase family protein [Betaproteobacteria bacterium]|nr:ornithine cyclodeaminase family protein [Betaproteobacteria bacterium]